MAENHYDVISNTAGFTCANADHHKSEHKKCKACKSEIKCDTEETQMSCIKCCKYFNGKSCFNNHIENVSSTPICAKSAIGVIKLQM